MMKSSNVENQPSITGTRLARAGFTLIELLTVIAIIGILAAILIPVVGRVRESARQAICVSNLRQVGIAMNLYIDEHNDLLPGPFYSTGAIHAYPNPSNSRLSYYIAEYVDVPQPPPGQTSVVDVLVCPSFEASAPSEAYVRTGISYRVNVGGTRQAFLYGTTIMNEGRGKRISSIENPTRTYALADDFNPAGGGWSVAPLHPNVRNVLFVDGHVDALDAEEYSTHASLQALQD